jgi:radical SAM superfamily enzyme YgiQ (UPF0313 family)
VAILDAEVEGLTVEETARKITKYNPLLTAIIVLGINPSVSSTPKMTAIAQIIRKVKKYSPYIKTVVGGLHPSALPDMTLRETRTDFVSEGEGFLTIHGLLQTLKFKAPSAAQFVPGLWYDEPGTRIYGGKANLINVDSLPMAAWDLLPMEKYRAHNWSCLDRLDQRSPYAVVFTSFGCPFSCTYCPIHAMYGGKPGIRYRDPQKVAEEIDHLVKNYGVRNIKFMDEMFALKQSHVIAVCQRIAKLGHDLNIWAYARADTLTQDMAKVMREAGIRWLCFGFESASETARRGVAKRYKQEEIGRVVDVCHSAGINIIANFMVGLPDDDFETMQATLDMAKHYNFEWFNIYACAAYPGSQLYEDAQKKGVKLPKKWEDYSQFSPGFVPLPTKYVSAEEVLRFRDKAFQEYFSRPEYLKMIEGKFGVKAREHIEEMLKVKVERR